MKKSKLLIPLMLTPCVCTITSLVSCNKQESQEQKLAAMIYDPTVKEPQQLEEGKTLHDKFNEMSSDDKVKEVVYDLFGFFNIDGWFTSGDKSLMDLYQDKTCNFIPLFNKLEIEQDKDDVSKWYVTCLGYISISFVKDYGLYKQNDYVMLTYDMSKVSIEFTENNSILYQVNDTQKSVTPIVGIVKQRIGGQEKLFSLESVDTIFYAEQSPKLPTNSQNWIK